MKEKRTHTKVEGHDADFRNLEGPLVCLKILAMHRPSKARGRT